MSAQSDAVRLDLILKGGHVIDPSNGIDGVMDLGIADHKIARVARNIPTTMTDQMLDLTGAYVTPGLIDMHCHVCTSHPRSRLSVPAGAHCFPSGVTTAVDAGTSGWRDFAEFKAQVIDRSPVRILSYVNIVGQGMGGAWEHESSEMRPKLAAAVAEEYGDVVVGIKTAHYWAGRDFDAAHPPWLAVDAAIEAAHMCGKPVMVDFFPHPTERPYPRLILEKLRAGDIHTHVFAQQFPVLDERARVNDFMFRARDRGVIFDLGHGAASFWYRNAAPAIEQGFAPDSISTDLHTGNVNGSVFDMLTTVSKCLNLGLTLADVIARSTTAPAAEIGHPELGTLAVGSAADVAVFRLDQGDFSFVDCGQSRLAGRQKLICLLTLRAGQCVYNPTGIGLPEWTDSPERYWWDPARKRSTRPTS